MSYHANVTAALHLVSDIMPLVWQVRPNARVQIVGKDPPREIRELAIHHWPLAISTGTVPDIRPFLRGATVAVAPIAYGAGIQNKVLEAMACGTPVVATTQAVSALGARDGEQLLIGDGAEAFARQVLRLLEDGELRRRIGQAGRCYVEKNHDWDGIVDRLVETYAEVIERRHYE
jgi:glycosyltransferase involved in cell wall biosynthesis